MARLSISFIALVACVSGSICVPARARDGTGSADAAFYLFGASWCAPCLAELRDIDAIADAAAPLPLIVLWDDEAPASALRTNRRNVKFYQGAPARVVRDRLQRDAAGLPYSVLVDADGIVCGERNGPLSAAWVARLKQGCRSLAGK